jgi:hypothetical protein
MKTHNPEDAAVTVINDILQTQSYSRVDNADKDLGLVPTSSATLSTATA